ncbi:HisA/HisF-related TIM barrel protein [Aquamicrobium sp. LC103]|uniref:HisA/HisF-related TIM barrel protein n=1 Tax=Aquamicrobium sp. LC103 TaxID=1120658 RepID=UPI00063E9911|nr:HisA/HisF-related TIM barrel protein [Aquamicrobium sp. LC103]
MRIVPVLDIKGGVVVRAKAGRRDEYRPIVTPLSASADPVGVAEGLRGLHPFRTFYVADLDAIEGRGDNDAALGRLCEMPAAPELWVDAGLRDERSLSRFLEHPPLRPVIGSESRPDIELLRRFRDHPALILSLDFFSDGYRGPANLLADPELWPRRIIVMTLARVGSASGPDYARLRQIKALAGRRDVVAAGGIRNEADIRELSLLGIEAALVATSLHDGTLSREQLADFG